MIPGSLKLEIGVLNLTTTHVLTLSASSTAFLGVSTPQPCLSVSTPATLSAVSIRIRFTCDGVRRGFASNMQAMVEATIGEANEVPSTNL